jgi:hypothetical protein
MIVGITLGSVVLEDAPFSSHPRHAFVQGKARMWRQVDRRLNFWQVCYDHDTHPIPFLPLPRIAIPTQNPGSNLPFFPR